MCVCVCIEEMRLFGLKDSHKFSLLKTVTFSLPVTNMKCGRPPLKWPGHAPSLPIALEVASLLWQVCEATCCFIKCRALG